VLAKAHGAVDRGQLVALFGDIQSPFMRAMRLLARRSRSTARSTGGSSSRSPASAASCRSATFRAKRVSGSRAATSRHGAYRLATLVLQCLFLIFLWSCHVLRAAASASLCSGFASGGGRAHCRRSQSP
jgi:hypothetical protein